MKGPSNGSEQGEKSSKNARMKKWASMAVLCSFIGSTAGLGCAALQVKALGRQLGDESATVRDVAAWNLGKTALKGTDISTAVGALVNALGDEDIYVQISAITALGNAAINEKSRDATLIVLREALGNKNAKIRSNAVQVLNQVIDKRMDISAFVGALGTLLGDREEDVRDSVMRTLVHAAEDGTDVSTLIGLLLPAMREGKGASAVLEYAAINEKSRGTVLKALEAALRNDDAEIRYGALCVLGDAARGGADIGAVVEILVKILRGESIQCAAGGALAHAAANGTDGCAEIGGLDQQPEPLVISRQLVPETREFADQGQWWLEIQFEDAAAEELILTATDALLYAAANGTDISAAIGVLHYQLEPHGQLFPGDGEGVDDAEPQIEEKAARALECAATNEKSKEAVLGIWRKDLKDENAEMRSYAACAFTSVADKETDIIKVVGELGTALEDEDCDVRRCAAETLEMAARNGTDISAGVGALGRLLGEDYIYLQEAITLALESATINKKSRAVALRVLGAALEDPNATVQKNAARILRNVAEKGVDVSAFAEKLKLIPSPPAPP